jgi:tetratricopeptide (TPR) repeat protein
LILRFTPRQFKTLKASRHVALIILVCAFLNAFPTRVMAASWGPNLDDPIIRGVVIQQADGNIQRNPKDTRAYASRAAAFLYGGQLDRAIADLHMLTDINPTDGHWRDLKANAEAIKGDYNAAIADESAAILAQPDVPAFYVNRSTMNLMAGRLQAASADSLKAINMNSRLAGAYENLAEVQFRMKNYKIVLEYCNSAILRAPNFPDAYYLRGRAYDSLGNQMQAAQDKAKAKDLGFKGEPTIYKSQFDN